MNSLRIRRFENKDAEEISKIIRRNFSEVNVKDYSVVEMDVLASIYNSQKVIDVASYAHMYVATIDSTIVGCGTVSSYWGKEDESILLTIFVLPELHGKGIGRKIVKTLENDEYFFRAKRIEIPASITSYQFYRKMGYDFKNGFKELDSENHYRLEKFR